MPNSAYVANSNSNNVSVIDTSGLTVVATIAVGTSPRGVAVTPNLATAYVTNFGSNNVSIINTATNTVSGTIAVGNGPGGICVSPDGSLIVVANYTDGTVSVISTASNTVIGLYTLPVHGSFTNPYAICVDPTSSVGYVATQVGGGAVGWVEGFNIAGLTTTGSYNTGSSASTSTLISIQGICVNPAGTRVYVTGLLSGNIYVINPSGFTLVTTMLDFIGEPRSICVLPDSSKGFWNGSAGELYEFNPATNTVTTNTTLGSGPDGLTGIAPTSDSTLLFVADSLSGTGANVWKVITATLAATNLSTAQNHANGIGLSLYPGPSEQIVMIV